MKHSEATQDIVIHGVLDRSTVPEYIGLTRHASPEQIDLSGISGLDPAGIVFLEQLLRRYPQQSAAALDSLPERLRALYHESSRELPLLPEAERPSLFEQAGARVATRIDRSIAFMQLTADSMVWSLSGIFRPRDRRHGSVMQHCYTMGSQAVGIITLLSFILGFILALQSAIQLQQFGAGMMVANLIALALLHEMGPIMTSIVVAGRTGSSTASEIATMQVTEELDALRMMGMQPVRYVVVPKIMAITLVMPLLLTLSIAAGVLGGAVVGYYYLDINPYTYLQQSLDVLVLSDMLRSYIKTVIFAWVIVLIGAHYGFHVSGGAEGVGKATTQSVVAAIFAVLVLDALFSLTLLWG